MAHSKLRVLLDLSMAGRGYCGIGQEVRLLYKALATCPDVEVTGLVYRSSLLATIRRFLPLDAPLGDRLENQARALCALTGDFEWPAFRPWRIIAKAHALAATAVTSRARLDPLEVEFLWQVIWRLLFSQTLAPDDMHLVRNGKFLLSNLSDGMIYARTLTNRQPIKLDTRGYDFLIVQGPRPFRVSPGTRLIVRYHDMIPVLQPDVVSNPWVIAWHHNAICQCRRDSFFVCDSDPTRHDLTAVYPNLAGRSATIPCMVSSAFRRDPNPALVGSILETRQSKTSGASPREPLPRISHYLMCVGTLDRRKNVDGLIRAFATLRLRPSMKQKFPDLKLLIVGSPGWKYASIQAALRGPIERGEIVHLEKVATEELRVLYTHAEALVFPSFSEGFGLPPVESLSCGTPVIVSEIAEHRWVLGDAALYCNPYDAASIGDAVERLMASKESSALRAALIARGRERVKRYMHSRCSGQWNELLNRLKNEPGAANRLELDQAA